MIRRSIISFARRSVQNASMAVTSGNILTSSVNGLHFAQRAVKTTSDVPHFVCTKDILACHCDNSKAFIQIGDANRVVSPSSEVISTPFSRVRLQGSSAVCIFRKGTLLFQCFGNCSSEPSGGEFQVIDGDMYAVVSGVTCNDKAQGSFKLLESYLMEERMVSSMNSLLQREKGQDVPLLDLEYVAEVFLLDLRSPSSTVVLGRVLQNTPKNCLDPPLSSESL